MYTTKGPNVLPTLTAVATSTGVVNRYLVQRSLSVNFLAYTVLTTFSSSAATVLQFIYRPTLASATGQVVLGTVSIPTGAVAGTSYYNLIKNSDCPAGGEIVVNVQTASSSAGAGMGWIESDEDPEVLGNNSLFTLVTA